MNREQRRKLAKQNRSNKPKNETKSIDPALFFKAFQEGLRLDSSLGDSNQSAQSLHDMAFLVAQSFFNAHIKEYTDSDKTMKWTSKVGENGFLSQYPEYVYLKNNPYYYQLESLFEQLVQDTKDQSVQAHFYCLHDFFMALHIFGNQIVPLHFQFRRFLNTFAICFPLKQGMENNKVSNDADIDFDVYRHLIIKYQPFKKMIFDWKNVMDICIKMYVRVFFQALQSVASFEKINTVFENPDELKSFDYSKLSVEEIEQIELAGFIHKMYKLLVGYCYEKNYDIKKVTHSVISEMQAIDQFFHQSVSTIDDEVSYDSICERLSLALMSNQKEAYRDLIGSLRLVKDNRKDSMDVYYYELLYYQFFEFSDARSFKLNELYVKIPKSSKYFANVSTIMIENKALEQDYHALTQAINTHNQHYTPLNYFFVCEQIYKFLYHNGQEDMDQIIHDSISYLSAYKSEWWKNNDETNLFCKENFLVHQIQLFSHFIELLLNNIEYNYMNQILDYDEVISFIKSKKIMNKIYQILNISNDWFEPVLKSMFHNNSFCVNDHTIEILIKSFKINVSYIEADKIRLVDHLLSCIYMISPLVDYLNLLERLSKYVASMNQRWAYKHIIVYQQYIDSEERESNKHSILSSMKLPEYVKPRFENRVLDLFGKISKKSVILLKSAEQNYQLLKNSYGWQDAGMLALSFYRIIEIELKERLISPLSHSLKKTNLLEAVKLLGNMKKTNFPIDRVYLKSKDSSTPSNEFVYAYETLQLLWNRSETKDLSLEQIYYTIQLYRANAPTSPALLVNLLDNFKKIFEEQLTDLGKTSILAGVLSNIIGFENRNKYRNPPAHAIYMSYDLVPQCREFVIEALQNFNKWFLVKA